MSDNQRLDGIDERLYAIEKQCADLQQQIIQLKRTRATTSGSDHMALHLTAEWRGQQYHVTHEILSIDKYSNELLCTVVMDSINRMRDELIKRYIWNADA